MEDRASYSYVENGELKAIMPDYFAEVKEICDCHKKFLYSKTGRIIILLRISMAWML